MNDILEDKPTHSSSKDIEVEQRVTRLKQHAAAQRRQTADVLAPADTEKIDDLLTLVQACSQIAGRLGVTVTPAAVEAMLEQHPITKMYARKIGEVWYVPAKDLPTLRWYVQRLGK